MIYFYSAFTEFGGSTLILDAVVRLLNEGGIPTEFHGQHDWFTQLSPHNRRGYPATGEDDVLLSHMHSPRHRADVRKSIYVCHEPVSTFHSGRGACFGCGYEGVITGRRARSNRIWDCSKCKQRKFEYHSPGSHELVVFSSANHEVKSRTLQVCWGPSTVITNPIEVDFDWQPPKEKVAGIVGTVGERKQPHISIRRAQQAGFTKILLFGNKEDVYFERYIKPLLNNDIQYMGLVLDKQEIYSSVSEVFHYSSNEQAAMVLGECKVLGIPFHCSPEVLDWTPVPREQLFEQWKAILS